MTLELTLLVLESVLLIFTVVLLAMSIREGRSRDALLSELGRAVKVLTRHEYFLSVMDSMMDAEREVLACITGRLPLGEDKLRCKEVAAQIERLKAKGVRVRYLLPRFQDRLHVGWLYSRAGAEVRYSGCPLAMDFRYTVVDGRLSIVGLPEASDGKEATKKGYLIPSEGLGGILTRHFEDCWSDTVSYEGFVRETLSQTGVTPKALAEELKMEEAELRRAAGL